MYKIKILPLFINTANDKMLHTGCPMVIVGQKYLENLKSQRVKVLYEALRPNNLKHLQTVELPEALEANRHLIILNILIFEIELFYSHFLQDSKCNSRSPRTSTFGDQESFHLKTDTNIIMLKNLTQNLILKKQQN